MLYAVEGAICEVLLAKLRQASPSPTGVALPQDGRALAVARAVMENPAVSEPLAAVCAQAGLGVRTPERAFQREVGMNFESWRRQFRLMRAVELLVGATKP
jgi:transcriptional regulator GlxA family with amidase domain